MGNRKVSAHSSAWVQRRLRRAALLGQAQQLQRLTPNATLVVLPGVGHIPQIEDVELFNTKITEILRRLAPALSTDSNKGERP